MDKLKFTATSGIYGDCTQCYKVSFPSDMTLNEFVNEILASRKDEWGKILYSPFKDKFISNEDIIIEYRNGKILYMSDNFDSIKNNTFSAVSANGGWSTMSYIIS